MRIVSITLALACAFGAGLLAQPAAGLVTQIADGKWWQGLTPSEKTASVVGMVSAYNFGYVAGKTDQMFSDAPYIEFRLRSEHLSKFESFKRKTDWMISSVPTPPREFTKSYKSYADSLDDFYDNYPDLLKLEVGEIIKCNSVDAPIACDALAKAKRNLPSPLPQ